ncbi:non-specific serine/threonine protein kinase [Trifolium repens]|nr:non-specific serine/threonine protein kinase [Trifolium repens]
MEKEKLVKFTDQQLRIATDNYSYRLGRRNHDASISESREWFPMLVWKKFDAEEVEDLLVACGIEEKNMEIVERMVKYQLELASA